APSGRIRARFDAGWRFRPDLPAVVAAGAFRWTWRTAGVTKLDVPTLPATLEQGDWHPASVGEDVFRGRPGFAWFRTDLGGDVKAGSQLLHFESVDDNAAVYLNGTRLLRHTGWNDPFDVPLRGTWRPGGPNLLIVLVENT